MLTTKPIDLRPDHAEIIHQILKDNLEEGTYVFAFGSRANWTAKQSSDLDLAIDSFGEKMDRKVKANLEDAFEECDLPYTVDVVDYNSISDSFREVIKDDMVRVLWDWSLTLLEDLISDEICRGITPKYTDKENLFAWVINQKCIRDNKVNIKLARKNDLSIRKVSTVKLLQDYDVLVNSTGVGTLGRVAQFKLKDAHPCTVDSHVTIIRPNQDIIDPIYLGYLIKAKQSEIEYLGEGSTGQTELSRENLKSLSILHTKNRSEQKRIAEILSSLDDKIEINKQINQTLEEMAQTLFRQWFDNYESKAYKFYSLDELVSQLKPGTNYQPKRVEKGIPFLNVRNLSNGFIDDSDFKFITEEEYKRVHKSWQPEEHDILISRIGTLGLVATIRKEDLPIAVHYNMINLKAKRTSFQFLYYLLKSEYFQIEYDTVKRASVQEYVAIDDAKNIQIPLFKDNNEFLNFEKQFIPLFDKTEKNFNQIKTLENMRDTLLPKLMSGEVRVKL